MAPRLPDTITLAPGESFGIHRDGWLEFRWSDLVGERSLSHLADIPSIEIPDPDGAAPPVDRIEEGRFEGALREAIGGSLGEADLFGRVARCLEGSLPGRPQICARILKVRPGGEFEVIAPDLEPERPFRPSARIVRELYAGASAVKGNPRMVGGRSTRMGAACSLDYRFEWIVAQPVGAGGAGELPGDIRRGFVPLLLDGSPVCLYIEASGKNGRPPRAVLPYFRLACRLICQSLGREG